MNIKQKFEKKNCLCGQLSIWEITPKYSYHGCATLMKICISFFVGVCVCVCECVWVCAGVWVCVCVFAHVCVVYEINAGSNILDIKFINKFMASLTFYL